MTLPVFLYASFRCRSPAFCAADSNPTTSPSSPPAKHIWMANNSFRFLRLALLLRRFSITPPPPRPTAVSGIPWTPTPAMALFCRRAFRLNPPAAVGAEVGEREARRTRTERRPARTLELLDEGRYERRVTGFVKLTVLLKAETSVREFQNKTQHW